MADKTEFLPLAGEQQTTDVASNSVITPVTTASNFVPIVVSSGFGGRKTVRFMKRRGYQRAFNQTTTVFYIFSQAIQWTGLVSTGTAPSTSRGVIVWTEERAGVNMLLRQYDTTTSTLGTFGTANYNCVGIQETLISAVPNLTLNVRLTSSPWTQKLLYFPNGGALTENTDGDLPTGIIGCGVNMDGYYFFAANSSAGNNIWNTDVNSLSAVTATSFIAAQSVPDTLVGLARIKNLILALGTRSIEFFQNVGNASGSPLQRIDNAALQIGVLHQLAAQKIGDDLIFVSISSDGVGVHLLSGGQPKKVSTQFIDAALAHIADSPANSPLAGAVPPLTSNQIRFCGVANLHGIAYAVLAIGGQFYAYSPSQDQWITLTRSGGQMFFIFAAGGQQFMATADQGPQNVMGYFDPFGSLTSSGFDYVDQLAMTAIFQTPPITHGTPNIKFAKRLQLLGDLQSVATPVIVSYSDDDGATWTVWGTVDMSVNPPIPLTFGGGSYRRRIYKFSNTSAAGCEIDGAQETFSIGLS